MSEPVATTRRKGDSARSRRRIAMVALAVGALVALTALVIHGREHPSPPSSVIHVQAVSPRLRVGQLLALVPPGHLHGIIEGEFLSCGPIGHVLKPAQMARRPV